MSRSGHNISFRKQHNNCRCKSTQAFQCCIICNDLRAFRRANTNILCHEDVLIKHIFIALETLKMNIASYLIVLQSVPFITSKKPNKIETTSAH